MLSVSVIYGDTVEVRPAFTGPAGHTDHPLVYQRCGDIEVGKQYVVQPSNKQKTKNRGRKVEVLEFRHDHYDAEQKDIPETHVRFLDTNRRGKVDAMDLVPAP